MERGFHLKGLRNQWFREPTITKPCGARRRKAQLKRSGVQDACKLKSVSRAISPR